MRHVAPDRLNCRALAGLAAAVYLLATSPSLAQQAVSGVPPSAPINANAQVPNTGFAAGPSQQIAQPGLGALFGSPFGSDHLFGDWGGAQTWLHNHGLEVDLDYLTENTGNVTGGRSQGFAYAGQIGLEVDVDLGKLFGLNGFALHTMTVQRSGTNGSVGTIGDDLATTQEIYGGGGNVIAHSVYDYFEKSLQHDRIDLAAGWLPVGTYFASSPLYCDFINVLFCGNPHPLPNYPGELDWPQATLGAQVRYLVTPLIYVMVGAFQTDPDFGTGGGGISGWAWADSKKSGISIPVELGWVPSFGPQHLIGHYKVGYDRDTHRYADVLNNRQGVPQLIYGGTLASQDRDDEYVLFDQMLVRQGKADTDGIIVLGGWVHATDAVSPLAQHAFVASTTTGSYWGRPQDTVGVSFNWIEMSGQFTRAEEIALEQGQTLPFNIDGFGEAYGPQNTEDVVELDYVANIYHGVTFVPDFQYIIRPGATTNTPDAAVLGFRTNINF